MITEGELIWEPGPERKQRTNLCAYTKWLKQERNLEFSDYKDLWQWSVDNIEDFWESIWDYFKIESSTPYTAVLVKREMPGAQWFPGASINYAQQALRQEKPDTPALLYQSETQPLTELSWKELGEKVRIIATSLREAGIKPGDCVVAYMPNIPEAVIAMLATTSIGAVWSSSSPDFGTRSVLDRFKQIKPKVLFCVDGYRYGGKDFDKSLEVRDIIAQLESLEHIVYLPYNSKGDAEERLSDKVILWDELLDHASVSAEDFSFEQVPFGHPLWILFSSGTTDLPKPIVHSHGGIILEQLKALSFHMDLHPGERMFFFTTTGWMVWNFVVSSLLAGVTPLLYDGNPTYPESDVLWKLIDDSGACFFGASPTYVTILEKAGIVPKDRFDLSHLTSIILAGSPVSPECMQWFYDNVKKDLWVVSGSGGTDICTGITGGVPTQPVYAGEIQAVCLGIDAHAFNDAGEKVIDEVGELVILKPMPSMPICFWNDEGNQRYLSSYFENFPGIWRHGDFFRINSRGGCFVLGRSDSTLNRFGVRIGTAEVYRTLEFLDEVDDSLILNLDLPRGRFFMPLFVKLREGLALSEELEQKICSKLRSDYSPRHVPEKIYQVKAIPYTLTGKKMEIPVRKILMGVPIEKAASRDAMSNPESLDYFLDYSQVQQDYKLA